MEEPNILPKRVRRLAIATGIVSALALFPILFLLYPALLILGGIIQPRFPSTGRWLVWAGAAMLGAPLIVYDIMLFVRPEGRAPLNMTLTFPPATILLAWCYAELVANGVRRLRARRFRAPAESRPIGWGPWAVAALLTLYIAWDLGGLLGWYRGLNDHRLDAGTRVAVSMHLVRLLIVVAFDISLVGRDVKVRKSRMTQF
ncbi:MAG: hypothetical protein WAN17_01950 [Candidatus Sulfotelmatobacter sp.]